MEQKWPSVYNRNSFETALHKIKKGYKTTFNTLHMSFKFNNYKLVIINKSNLIRFYVLMLCFEKASALKTSASNFIHPFWSLGRFQRSGGGLTAGMGVIKIHKPSRSCHVHSAADFRIFFIRDEVYASQRVANSHQVFYLICI